MGAKGEAATTIADITGAADVGLGSFYNHFGSKADILEAAARDALSRNGDAIDSLIQGIEDPVAAMATAWHESMAFGLRHPRLGRFVMRGGATAIIEQELTTRLVRDLERGVAAGYFRLTDVQATALAVTGAQSAVMRAILEERADPDAITEVSAQCLMVIGVPFEQAWEAARASADRS